MPIDAVRIKNLLNDYQKLGLDSKNKGDELDFLPAICYVNLGDYEGARLLFEKSFAAMFSPTTRWKKTAQPHWLVDTGVLSGRRVFFPYIGRELEAFEAGPKGNTYLAYYSYALVELLLSPRANVDQWIEGLLRDPKCKEGYAMGQMIQAITLVDQAAFNIGLRGLLKTQEALAQHGGLRDTAEGLLCMPAMSLAYIALQKGMKIEEESDYLSTGYLNFLLAYTRA